MSSLQTTVRFLVSRVLLSTRSMPEFELSTRLQELQVQYEAHQSSRGPLH
jgi:hypothetical protein